MSAAPGTRFGPYEVLAPIGAGGMGEVYKARDTRLDRMVAIKILPAEKTGDAEHKLRFLQEAKAASALNHPNIVTIYDIGSENGVDYIAMEFIAGKTMDQLIPRNGMRIGELLRYATQAADALSKAHQAGIIHRDLKPSNIMVTSDGLVKILDFGLAKLTAARPSEGDATRTIKAITGDGTVLGTAFYMSPEQAEGKPVDARSDIFSFGAMLFEMATGQRPFSGASQIAVLSSILREEPKPPGSIRGDLPAELTRVISRCLRKDPARRFQHTADLKVALEELKEESDSGSLGAVSPLAPARRYYGPWMWPAVGVIALVAAAAALLGWRLHSPSTPAAVAVSTPIPLTSYPGTQMQPSFSPDGTQIIFSWNGPGEDNYDIYVKVIGPGTALRLTTDPAVDEYPQWSPDGRSIAFLRMAPHFDHFSVIVIPALGGPERRVGVFPNNPVVAGLTMEALCWTADSKALIVSTAETPSDPNRLVLVPLDGEPKTLTHPDPLSYGDTRPAVSSDGRQLAFLRTKSGYSALFVVPVSAAMVPEGQPRALAADQPYVGRPAWLPDDREILFVSTVSSASRSLFRISTEPGAVERAIPTVGASAYEPALSRSGNRLAFASGRDDTNFWSVDLTAKTSRMDSALSSSYRDVFPQFSPDGKRVCFYSSRSGTVQIWVANRDGSQAAALTSMVGPTTASPRWSPDGQQIAFDSNTGGAYHIYAIPADGGQPRKLTPGQGFLANWSRDGRWIYFAAGKSGNEQVWKIPAAGGEPVQVTHGGGYGAVESPDGKALYFSRQNGAAGIWKIPVDGGPETQVIPNVYRVNFAVTGKGIYYTPQPSADGTSSVEFYSFATRSSTEIVKVAKLLDLGLGVSPDGKTLLYSQVDRTGSNIMLIENFR